MDRQTAKEELKNREPDFLEPAKTKVNGHITYICPSCGNGSGSTGDGIALDPKSKSGKRYKCFVCGLSEDIIGLWKLHTGTEDNREAFKSLYENYGITVDSSTAREDFGSGKEYQKQDKNEQNTHTNIHTDTYTQTQQKANHEGYYKTCQNRITETDYPARRGLSEETIKRFMLGYDPQYRAFSKDLNGWTEWKALIIPTGYNSYIARNTDPEADKGDRYRKKGSSLLYNAGALRDAVQPVFICEGELDALSIVEAGGEAVGLGSTANYRQLVGKLQKQKPAQPLIIALDNDKDGEETTEKITSKLEELGVPFYRCNPYGENKDANEALLSDREGFIKAVGEAIEEAKKAEEELLEAQREEYLKSSVANHLQEFINGIADSVNTPYTPTGYNVLDQALEGGLYEGLYIVGAISSLGKTTLITQIADQIAQNGGDVLIFSLEMARTELMAKSISRLTLLDVLENKGDMRDAKTTRGITTGSRYANYSQTERELIERAIKAYGEYANHLFIYEGVGDIGAEQIREIVADHTRFTKRKPVVIIDYLQILAPSDVRATDKQNTDKAVLELKRISRDYKIPVIGISSFNRASYSAKVTFEAFKESGAIEYSSDVLIGLQLHGVGKDDFNVNEAKSKNPREIELVILKNRNGQTGTAIHYDYYPMFNYFEEVTRETVQAKKDRHLKQAGIL